MENQILQSQEQTQTRTPALWRLDPAHSSAEFAVRHMMVATVKGSFKTLSGTIGLDEAYPANSKVDVEIEAATIDTGVPDRDAHLRSPDFFDVERFPKLVFRSTGIEPEGEDTGKLRGEITIHGVTKSVTFDVTYLGEIRDPWRNRRRGYSAEATLNRKDFGMTWNMVLDAGGVLVGDKVKVAVNLEAVEQANA